METHPKLVEELQAGLAAKLNAIPALPADVNPKLARPGFERGFQAGLLDAKLAAVVVDFATNVALALSGDLAILAEQAGATALRAAIARFKSMPVLLPATIGAGGGFVRLPKAPIAQAAKGAVTYGDNATSKLRNHWGDIQRLAKEHGVQLPGKFKEADTQIRNFIENVVRLGKTKVGPYKPTGGGWPDALWSKYGNAIVIRSPEGKFVTILDAAGGGAALNYPGGL